MSDWNTNTVLGREVEAYNSAVKRYQQKLDWYNDLPYQKGFSNKKVETIAEAPVLDQEGRPKRDWSGKPVMAPTTRVVEPEEVTSQAPKDPFKGATEQAKAAAQKEPGLADYIRSGSGLLGAILGRKEDA